MIANFIKLIMVGKCPNSFKIKDKEFITRKYPLRGYILGSGAPGTPGVIPMTHGATFISDIL